MALSNYQMRRRVFRAGYSIPRQADWMFWPMGFKPPEPVVVEAEEGSVLTVENVAAPPPLSVSNQILSRQFKLTNEEAFLATLRNLGLVKEIK